MAQKKPYLLIDEKDNVIVAIEDLNKGVVIRTKGASFNLQENVQSKHKFARFGINAGDPVIMYGVLIGKARTKIGQGYPITIGNVEHASSDYSKREAKAAWQAPDVSKWGKRYFQGYHRKDGKVGTANYWVIFALTFCENRNLDVLHTALSDTLGYETSKDFVVDTSQLVEKLHSGGTDEELMSTQVISTREDIIKRRIFPNIDGIKVLRHDGGCGGTREDAETLCHLLAGYLTNPNVAGGTVLSLGCQNAEVKLLEQALSVRDQDFSKPLVILEQQQGTSERAFIAEAVKKTFIGLKKANENRRKPASVDKLVIGLECGGSDGFSGLSANPALGYTSDLIVACGGSAILSEFPELNGVEQDLMDRCVRDEDAGKFASIMKTYGQRAKEVGSGFENNPSPGNIKDGLITDAMKSAGAAKKGGTSPVVDVLDYTQPVVINGLNLLCTPGNDVESTTGLAASGANIIVFTTGLGTPTGNPVVPVIKLSSNNELSLRMRDIIDVNAGTIISGEDSIETKGEEILEYIIKVASGELLPHAVRLGQDDFIPWKRGISL